MLTLRVRTAEGQNTLEVAPDTSLGDVKLLLFSLTNISPGEQLLRGGYPPKPIVLDDSVAVGTILENGDSITVERDESAAAPSSQPTPTTTTSNTPNSQPTTTATSTAASGSAWAWEGESTVTGATPNSCPCKGGYLVRRIIADDNSCLFNAVGLNLLRSRGEASTLRQMVAATIQESPTEWTEAVLGKPTSEYQTWILEPSHWGGGVELVILARYFATEIVVVDSQTSRFDVFGSDGGYQQRCYIVYDGIHYDSLALAPSLDASEETDVTTFDVNDDSVAAAARAIGEAAKKEHKFTDTANYALRCNVCSEPLKGNKEAAMHAQSTGHADFVEYVDQ